MKGILASRYSVQYGIYSDLCVLRSAAGYYIGTEFFHTSGEFTGLIEPGSRESEYFPTREAAQHALDNESWHQRTHP